MTDFGGAATVGGAEDVEGVGAKASARSQGAPGIPWDPLGFSRIFRKLRNFQKDFTFTFYTKGPRDPRGNSERGPRGPREILKGAPGAINQYFQ